MIDKLKADKDLIIDLYRNHKKPFLIALVIEFIVAWYFAGLFHQSIAHFADIGSGFGQWHFTYEMFHNVAYGFLEFPLNVFFFLLNFVVVFVAYKIMTDDSVSETLSLNYTNSEKDDHGSAGEMTKEEADEYFYKSTPEEADNFILGWADPAHKYVYTYVPKKGVMNPNNHIAICAATGRGKTTNTVLPMILQIIKRGESFISTDTSGENAKYLLKYCEQQGYEVRWLNLLHPKYSDGFNPMVLFEMTESPVGAAQQLTDLIIANRAPGREDDFFSQESGKFLTWAQLYIANPGSDEPISDDRNNKNIVAVRDFAQESTKEIVAKAKAMPNNHPAYDSAKTFVNDDDKSQHRAVHGTDTLLSSLLDPDLANVLKHNDIDLQDPGKKKCAYFVSVSATEPSRYWIAAVFYGALFIALVDCLANTKTDSKLDVPVNMIFDEFPNIFRILNFASILNNVRKNRINITMMFQGISDMQRRYPDEYDSLITACDTIIYQGTNSIEFTAPYFSRMTGEATVDTESGHHTDIVGFKKQGMAYTDSTSMRMALTSDEIRRLPKTKEIVFPATKKFLILDMFYWEKHPDFPKVQAAGMQDMFKYVPLWRKRLNGNAGSSGQPMTGQPMKQAGYTDQPYTNHSEYGDPNGNQSGDPYGDDDPSYGNQNPFEDDASYGDPTPYEGPLPFGDDSYDSPPEIEEPVIRNPFESFGPGDENLRKNIHPKSFIQDSSEQGDKAYRKVRPGLLNNKGQTITRTNKENKGKRKDTDEDGGFDPSNF